MFDTGKVTYKTDIALGQMYRDPFTKIEGKAVAIAFYEHACERVTIRFARKGQAMEATFDAPELIDVATGEPAKTTRTGGPARGSDARRAL